MGIVRSDRMKRAASPGEGASTMQSFKQTKTKAARPPPRSIAVYNYKGGCCKTFLSRELAAALVKLGLKVKAWHRPVIMREEYQVN